MKKVKNTIPHAKEFKVDNAKINPDVIVHQNTELIRINKYLSEKGICSRREADKVVQQHRVKINGIVAEMGSKVSKIDKVHLDNKLLAEDEKHVYIALNKPTGITCTTEPSVKGNISDYVNYEKRIYPIGRLDKESEGLILMTNDGNIVNKILRARNNHEKEYIVTVDRPITGNFINAMSSGVSILDTITKPCKIYKEDKFTFRIILTQGLNRQIRRMCEVFNYNVVKLKRIRIMNILLGELPIGYWKYISEHELKDLDKLLSTSTKEVST